MPGCQHLTRLYHKNNLKQHLTLKKRNGIKSMHGTTTTYQGKTTAPEKMA